MARLLQLDDVMNTALVVSLIAVCSTMTAAASADSTCFYQPCAAIVVDGGCDEDAGYGASCGEDAGRCRTISYQCENAGQKACLGPDPPPAESCPDQGGCAFAAHPARAAQQAALPASMLAAGALALLVDRRRRRAAKR